MLVKWGLPAFVVIPACLVVGGIMGAAQGYWVAYQKIPSFIVTLAGMLVFRGLTYVVLGGRPIGPFPKEFPAACRQASFRTSSTSSIRGPSLIQNMVALVAVLALVGYAIYCGRAQSPDQRAAR